MAQCGGDPTVNKTALELIPVPTGGATTTPGTPAGATTKSYVTLALFLSEPDIIGTLASSRATLRKSEGSLTILGQLSN